MLCSTYPFERKCMKWYKVLWHFCIETALVNSLICYNIVNPTKKLRPKLFRQKVIEGLLQGFAKRKVKRGRRSTKTYVLDKDIPEGQHFLRKHNTGHKPNCIVCSVMPSKCQKKGAGECKRKQTSYYCHVCPGQPSMCIVACFEDYHVKKIFKKTCKCN